MISGENPLTLADNSSFEAVLDQACDRLWDRKIRYSISRIREMEAHLNDLEQELDALALLNNRDGNG
jgi:hypothetical protein